MAEMMIVSVCFLAAVASLIASLVNLLNGKHQTGILDLIVCLNFLLLIGSIRTYHLVRIIRDKNK